MKTITTNNRTLLFVEVPEDADRFVLIHCRTRLAWFYPTYKRIDLPDTDYDRKFIATTDTITEEQAANIVKRKDNGMYIDYLHYGEPYHNATISFKSLLQHHSITGRHAIIEVL